MSKKDVGHKPRLVFQTPNEVKCVQTPKVPTVTVVTPSSSATAAAVAVLASPKVIGDSKQEITRTPIQCLADHNTPNVKSKDSHGDSEAIHTPVSIHVNKFRTCFKSEPNLSKALTERSDNVPMLHRGRFIAKKLLGGVSMVNLRFPFGSHSHDKRSSAEFTPKSTRALIARNGDNGINKKIIFNNENDDVHSTNLKPTDNQRIETIVTSHGSNRPQSIVSHPNRMDDDEDDVDFDEKENLPDVECDDPVYLEKVKQASIIQCAGSSVTTISCISRDNMSMSDSIIGDSVSPITKSTHRMPKAMQVS